MNNKPFISIENLHFGYTNYSDECCEKDEILKGIDLCINKGEFVAILGHNGSGKSTLAKHLNAILIPKSGNVYIDGLDTKTADIFEIRRRLGMVFQNPDNQIVSSVVEEDVAFALENLGVEVSEMRFRIDEALRAVDMQNFRLHSPSQLSGGQKQRIAIAGILAMHPECIVLDEPTAMLDPKGRRDVLRVITNLNRKFKTTIVLITHYMEEAAQCDRVIVMNKGKIQLDGTPKEIFSQVKILKEIGLDVPQTTELIYRLRSEGYSLDEQIISEDECIEAIIKLLEGKNDTANRKLNLHL